MKDRLKYFINLSVLFFIPLNLFSQQDFKDSTEAYNYWVQRGITEMVYSSMEDYSKQLSGAEQKGKELYYENYIKEIDKKDISCIDQTFKGIELLLNNNSWGLTANSFFLPLKSAYEQRKPLNDQFFTVDHNYEKIQNWEKKKAELLADYDNALDHLVVPTDTIQVAEIKTGTTPVEPPEEKIIPVWIWITFGFLLGFIAGCLLIYQYSKSKIYSILATEKYKYLDDLKQETGQNLLLRKFFKYVGIVALLKHSKDEKKNAIDNYVKEIVLLKKQNDKLKTENEKKEKVITDQKFTAYNQASARDYFDRQPDKSYGTTDNKMEIFFTIPEGDGSFKTINAKNGQDIDCFYKIILDKNGQKGKLYFISGDYDLRALDNIDYYLNPVCEIQNISDRTFARKILTTDPGSVVKRGDIWKIEENNKVKIKLV